MEVYKYVYENKPYTLDFNEGKLTIKSFDRKFVINVTRPIWLSLKKRIEDGTLMIKFEEKSLILSHFAELPPIIEPLLYYPNSYSVELDHIMLINYIKYIPRYNYDKPLCADLVYNGDKVVPLDSIKLTPITCKKFHILLTYENPFRFIERALDMSSRFTFTDIPTIVCYGFWPISH
jgi:hypothetical protein